MVRLQRCCLGMALLLLAVTVVIACSPLPVINALVPDDTFRPVRQLPYGPDERQRLDLYVPTTGTPPYKVVVFFYGGAWQWGSKEDFLFVGEALAEQGYLVVLPDYRVYPEVSFPGFVEDGAAAVRWVRDNIAAYGGDPLQIYLIGHSAGAHIAALLALDPAYLPPGTVRALIGLAGPYDFLPLTEPIQRNVMSVPATDPLLTQPIHYARPDAPPLLLLAGDEDELVEPGNTLRLAARVQRLGGQAWVKLYPDLDHKLILGAFALPLRGLAPVLADVSAFIDGETVGWPQRVRTRISSSL